MDSAHTLARRLIENVTRVIFGKDDVVELAVAGLLAQGHLLIEDVPGVGKTVLAKSIARSLGCSFNRLQFTPDMLPSDVTGVSIWNPQTREFEFRPGPLMAEIVLADEINRATPKTQAALLEAMEERQLTVDGVTHALPPLFQVLATQNPIEHEGTYPLPEAQMDRFLMRITVGYPPAAEEERVVESQQIKHPIEDLAAVAGAQDVLEAQKEVRGVHIERGVRQYIVDLVSRTRTLSDVHLGASPRGSLGLARAAQARAILAGRDYVAPDDVKAVAAPVLAHRLLLSPSARLKGVTPKSLIEGIIENTMVPGNI
ncbi:MAG: MoxR family ATPase [Anaerolineales bacterium]|nr:MoxR family ATPase [Anaerolineales bacterium]